MSFIRANQSATQKMKVPPALLPALSNKPEKTKCRVERNAVIAAKIPVRLCCWMIGVRIKKALPCTLVDVHGLKDTLKREKLRMGPAWRRGS